MIPVFYTDDYLSHQTGAFHPECADRLLVIVNALRLSPLAAELDWRVPLPAQIRDIERVHPRTYIESIERLAERGGGFLDPDTIVSRNSFAAACLAVGGWIEGASTVLKMTSPSFVLCRPPGHHAEPERGMGFCLFSNAAIAALWALEQESVQRVAIFDWDVHHGNGTQAVIEQWPNLAYVSIHQAPLYPGTGAVGETGIHHNIRNIPLAAGSNWDQYGRAMQEQVIPFLESFQPDLLLVSAGFDCAKGDPLAGMDLLPEDFGQMTEMCLQVTPNVVFGLEGGYDLQNLAASWIQVAQACLRAQKSVTE
jgi:acetoin utilization deacetylase AcuC-like enzyme